ncbi:APC family permease [Dermabacter sp. p3-SID358]|uniref:APC family permease n=1 Tax=Dermabacter sp. p3-SID358 TaxID=2916114 RepID=UPI0021A30115|nr:APC family permease [Dermabacter sp. p3-SID358]MCT1866159.1 APC family permease [Dermabacter sp. p3-SID358]
MPGPLASVKRIVIGRPFSSDRLARQRLPKRFAIPSFAADTVSALAYAPDEIILTLGLSGAGLATLSPWVGLSIVAVMAIVVGAHLNVIQEYPGGGSDFVVARKNLGAHAGRLAGAALVADYVLTVAVATSQAGAYLGGAIPGLAPFQTGIAIAIIALLTLVNLRGARELARLVSLPVYAFTALIALTLVCGATEALHGTLGLSPNAGSNPGPGEGAPASLTLVGGSLVMARAFSSGLPVVSGVKAITNTVPVFQPPKARNACITLLVSGTMTAALFIGVMFLASATGVSISPREAGGARVSEATPVLGQISEAIFGRGSFMSIAMLAMATLVLCIAANTAFTGLPVLTAALARSGYVPRVFASRGDRLVYSNGILLLAVLAVIVVLATGANISLLIHMYVVGVFTTFAIGQIGMFRHYSKKHRVAARLKERQYFARKRAVSIVAAACLTAILVTVATANFLLGAWVTLTAVALMWGAMTIVSRYYARIFSRLALDPDEDLGRWPIAAPSPLDGKDPMRGIVLVTQLNRPAIRAIKKAMASPHLGLQAVAVKTNDSAIDMLSSEWLRRKIPIPLRVLNSPYRDFLAPLDDYVRSFTRTYPRDAVVVYIPEFVVGHWWESIMHNHVLRRVTARLSRYERVTICPVPWDLDNPEHDASIAPAPSPVVKETTP